MSSLTEKHIPKLRAFFAVTRCRGKVVDSSSFSTLIGKATILFLDKSAHLLPPPLPIPHREKKLTGQVSLKMDFNISVILRTKCHFSNYYPGHLPNDRHDLSHTPSCTRETGIKTPEQILQLRATPIPLLYPLPPLPYKEAGTQPWPQTNFGG